MQFKGFFENLKKLGMFSKFLKFQIILDSSKNNNYTIKEIIK